MTLTVHNQTNVTAKGNRGNRNCKPIYCITTGEIFTSVKDAAEAIGVDVSTISHLLSGKRQSHSKGKRFCYLADITEHLEEISQHTILRNAKAQAYDEAIARKEALNRATEKLAHHKARYEKLAEQLEKEIDLMHEAEREVDSLKQKHNTIFDN